MNHHALNVNLKTCTCFRFGTYGLGHNRSCAALPLALSCPLEPFRSVEFTMALGECDCVPLRGPLAVGLNPWACSPGCASRPIRVICSIGGATWPESRPVAVEQMGIPPGEQREGAIGGVEFATPAQAAAALAACIERWKIVKALVLGQEGGCAAMPAAEQAGVGPLVKQRDAEYAALADMVRHEHGALEAQRRAEKAFPYHRFHRVGAGSHEAPPPSHARLVAFVEYLIEEVGRLP